MSASPATVCSRFLNETEEQCGKSAKYELIESCRCGENARDESGFCIEHAAEIRRRMSTEVIRCIHCGYPAMGLRSIPLVTA